MDDILLHPLFNDGLMTICSSHNHGSVGNGVHHFPLNQNGKRVELFSLKWKKSNALNQSSIRVSVVSMGKNPCSRRESQSSHPNQKFQPNATLYFFQCSLMFFVSPDPKKMQNYHSKKYFLLHPCCFTQNRPTLHKDSGGVVVKDTERPQTRRWKNNRHRFSFSKEKSDGFCVEFESGNLLFWTGPKKNSVCKKLIFFVKFSPSQSTLGKINVRKIFGFNRLKQNRSITSIICFCSPSSSPKNPSKVSRKPFQQWISGSSTVFQPRFFVLARFQCLPPTRNKAMIPS